MNNITLKLIDRLEKFQGTWLSNPAAQMEFIRLVDDVRQCPSSDHADEPLLEWLSEEKRRLRSIGIR